MCWGVFRAVSTAVQGEKNTAKNEGGGGSGSNRLKEKTNYLPYLPPKMLLLSLLAGVTTWQIEEGGNNRERRST